MWYHKIYGSVNWIIFYFHKTNILFEQHSQYTLPTSLISIHIENPYPETSLTHTIKIEFGKYLLCKWKVIFMEIKCATMLFRNNQTTIRFLQVHTKVIYEQIESIRTNKQAINTYRHISNNSHFLESNKKFLRLNV